MAQDSAVVGVLKNVFGADARASNMRAPNVLCTT
jgi:hypothetical protein